MTTVDVAVDPSTRPLSEVARYVVIPSGIVDSLWFDLDELFAEWGDEFDTWQDSLGQCILGLRDDGMFAATVGGVTLSIPRQVAKTFLVGRIVFALCAKFPNTKAIWTAHRVRTATQTFDKLKAVARRPTVRPYIAKGRNNGLDIRDANGEQEITFANGSVIMFGARESGFGRGFDEVDIEVFDEAQILTEKALEDMVAATNQSRFPHGALLFYMGTPPRPVDPGEVFRLRRDEALALVPDGKEFGEPVIGEDSLYVECSADRDAKPDDREQWAKANPSYPHRTPLTSMLRLRKNLLGVDSWRREALGIWDEVGGRIATLVDPDEWQRLEVDGAPDGVPSYGVRFSVDGSTVAVSVGVRHGDIVHVEGVHHALTLDGTRWLVDWFTSPRVASERPRWREANLIAVDGKAGAGALVKALRDAGVGEHAVVVPTTDQVVTAHKQFVDAVVEGSLSHIDDEALTGSVLAAARRPIGTQGGWGFLSADVDVDVTLAESAAFALWAALQEARKRSGVVW